MGRVDEPFDKPGIITADIIADKDDDVRTVLYLRQCGRDPTAGLQRFQVMPCMTFLRVQERGIRLFGQLQGCAQAVNVCAEAGDQWFAGLAQEFCRSA